MKNSQKIIIIAASAAMAGVGVFAAANLPHQNGVLAGEHEHWGNHYAENAPTGHLQGNKEYWVCCECHEHFLTQPATGKWTDKVLSDIDRNTLATDDDRVVLCPAPFSRDDKKDHVTTTANEDGTWTVSDTSGGILPGGTDQNWGEGGFTMFDAHGNTFNSLINAGYQYVKFDINFEESVTSFNYRYGSEPNGDNAMAFWIYGIGFDQELPNGRMVNIFDTNGKMVSQISHNTWYTMYMYLYDAGALNSLWANGGTAVKPAVFHLRNVAGTKDILHTCSPYFKGGAGTVETLKEGEFAGSFKLTRNDGNSVVNFRNVTHSSTETKTSKENTGGFFNSAETRYFIFDYYIGGANTAFNLETKGDNFPGGWGSTKGWFADKAKTPDGVTVFQNGAKADHLQDGWNTVMVDIEHKAGAGWNDFNFNIGDNPAYMKNIHYSATPLKA